MRLKKVGDLYKTAEGSFENHKRKVDFSDVDELISVEAPRTVEAFKKTKAKRLKGRPGQKEKISVSPVPVRDRSDRMKSPPMQQVSKWQDYYEGSKQKSAKHPVLSNKKNSKSPSRVYRTNAKNQLY